MGPNEEVFEGEEEEEALEGSFIDEQVPAVDEGLSDLVGAADESLEDRGILPPSPCGPGIAASHVGGWGLI